MLAIQMGGLERRKRWGRSYIQEYTIFIIGYAKVSNKIRGSRVTPRSRSPFNGDEHPLMVTFLHVLVSFCSCPPGC